MSQRSQVKGHANQRPQVKGHKSQRSHESKATSQRSHESKATSQEQFHVHHTTSISHLTKADGKSTLPWIMHVMKLLHNQDSNIDSPHSQSHLCTNLLYVEVNKSKRQSSTRLCARPALSSDGTSRCSVVFRRMSAAFTWERGCLWTVADQCGHDSKGV